MSRLNAKKTYRVLSKTYSDTELTVYRDGKELIQTRGIVTDHSIDGISFMLYPLDNFEYKINDVLDTGADKFFIDFIDLSAKQVGIWTVNTHHIDE